jgi:anti-sigma regulatory factor (Ser/Thr protein kinase)
VHHLQDSAINLFVRDMPRLSVDIDLTDLPLAPRPNALAGVDAAMKRMAANIPKAVKGAPVRAGNRLKARLEGGQAPRHSGNVRIDGPAVPLEPRAALALGMAIHELTTNAVKYGALSVPGGLVSVTWRLEQDEAERVLTLDWSESGGPPVTPPKRRGFGMTLIERGLRQDMSADVQVDFAAAGVRARLTAPLLAGTVILPAESRSE